MQPSLGWDSRDDMYVTNDVPEGHTDFAIRRPDGTTRIVAYTDQTARWARFLKACGGPGGMVLDGEEVVIGRTVAPQCLVVGAVTPGKTQAERLKEAVAAWYLDEQTPGQAHAFQNSLERQVASFFGLN